MNTSSDDHTNPTHTQPSTTSTADHHGSSRRRGGRTRGRKGAHMHDSMYFAEHSRGGGRHRARRGAVRSAILTLLDERPMHGYEIITELETRSEGRWRPSPGSVYPALEKMEDHGVVVSTDVDGKRQYSLTDHGREMFAEFQRSQDADDPAPWNQTAGGRGETRKVMAELVFQIRQISRFGTAEQRDAALAVLDDTKRRLYAILAEPPTPDAEPSDDPGDTNGDADAGHADA